MKNKIIAHTNRAFTLLSLLAIAACASSPADGASSDGTPSDPTPTETTQGAPLPSPNAAEAPSGTPAAGTTTNTPSANGTVPAGDPSTPGAPSGGPTGSTPGTPGAGTPPVPAATPMPYRGINLAGGEFGSAIPGTVGIDYAFPTTSEIDYYMSKGMNTFRMGFKWERMQPAANGAFNAAYEGGLAAIVTYATGKGAKVVVQPHNFARYYGNVVGSAQVPNTVFADFWSRMATKWGANPNVMFNLVNEPHDISATQWVSAANAAIVAIRATGSKNMIVVPGTNWTGAHSWSSGDGFGSSNAVAMVGIVDSGHNFLIEAHQYLDSDSSGGGGVCVSGTVGSERLSGWVKWLRDNKMRGMLGEFAGGDNATCNAAVKDMLTYMMANADVLDGWTWWAGGPMWGSYIFTLDPAGGADRPQMALLTPFLK
jgi:endoglucanase